MEKKKILILIDWFLPGFKAGGPIQSVANLIDHFKDEFEFSVITRDTDYCETLPYSTIKSNEWNVLPSGVKVYYFSKDQLSRSAIRQLIRNTAFDVIYLNGIYSIYFTLIPLIYLRKQANKKIIVAVRGMLSEGSLGVKKKKKLLFIRASKFLKLFDLVLFHATTEVEKMEIVSVFGKKMNIKVAANLPPKNFISSFPTREKVTGVLRLVNVARVSPEKNLLLALNVLKQVKENVEFDFYGPIYNQEYWLECKVALADLPGNIKANYKGVIESGKVLDALQGYHFMFMPTTGENFGHIILQAMITGCPVIISDKTPWQQLNKKNIGWDIPLDSLKTYAETIDNCAKMTQSDFDKISKSTFDYAQAYIQNPQTMEQNRLLFQ